MARIIYTHTDEAPLLATYSFLPIIAGVRRQGGRRGRDPRHLPGGPDHRPVPGRAHRRAADRRRARGARRAGHEARSQHHQAAQRLGLGPAAQGGGQGAAGAGLRPARLPGEPEDRRGQRHPRALRQGHGLGGQPGAARGQLRPPRAGVGQGLRQGAPAPHGRLVAPTRRPTSRRWARTTSAPTSSRWSSTSDDTLRIEHVAADGTVTVLKESIPVLAGEVVDGTYMNVAALRRFLAEQIARAKADGRAVLGAPQGHDDEGLRPDHLRPRRPGLLPDPVRAVRRRAQDRGHLAQRRPRRAALRGGGPARGRRDQGRRPAGARRRPGPGDGRLRQGHHQPARPVRRDRRRLDAGDDPQLGAHVGSRRRGARHPRGDPRLVVRRRLPDRPRRLPRPRRLRPGHHGLGAQRRPDGQGGRGVRLARQDLRGPRRRSGPGRERRRRRPHRAHRRARRHLARLPDQGRRRSATGSSSPSPAPAPPARPRCSGSTRPAPTTPT